MTIKVGQIYKHRHSNQQLLVAGKKGDMWNTKVLTGKPGVYNGSHKMSEYWLLKHFEQV